ncbi:MAG: peptide chain release factor N(5)-glutamine methyltransferase [Clostridia bacterium]|nr:peptide chain release factor N(5)-glutamine methyltransferase [Clostridia bacterium]
MRFREICDILKNAGIEGYLHEASLLLERFCGVSPSSLPLVKEKDFDVSELSDAVQKRADRYPLQYILGYWYFYEEKYIVNENCLIPRSDTEILVELAVKHLPPCAVFADLCTGSGCVAVSVLKHRPDTSAYALDLFEDTLKLAETNAKLNGVSDRFVPMKHDVLCPCEFCGTEDGLDAILSNPPYIKTQTINTLEPELTHEPHAALDGGEDGLVFYRAILDNHLCHLKQDGFIVFEIGFDQANDVGRLAELHGLSADIIKDFSGNDRVALLKKLH